MVKSINSILEEAINEHHEYPAFSDYEGDDFSYLDVALHVSQLHIYFKDAGVAAGDKVILLGRNSARWAISYISLLSYGAVVVPVLPDFKSKDFHYIIEHSESKLMMIDDEIYNLIYSDNDRKKLPAISLKDFSIIGEGKERQPIITNTLQNDNNTEVLNLKFEEIDDNNLGLLSYTSGTTGFSKGVMLSRKNLLSNVIYAQDHMPLKTGHKICSFLPMAHIYGQLFEFIFPFTLACHITFLNKMPSPTILLKAFEEIKPNLILSVPLILEKIYNNKLLPVIKKPLMRSLLFVPGINKIIGKKISDQLSQSFGNHFFEMVIGGAALNKEVETFLTKIGFRFTIGYGMTECAPLISYASWDTTRKESAGKIVDRMEVRIDSNDPFNEIGEIQVKGDNVMMGYNKDPQSTQEAFTDDGWFHTGDLGLIDNENYIYIKGRIKNMILGSNGKNIYPEEIENLINNLSLVQESVIIKDGNKLVALVYPDQLAIKAAKINKEQLEEELAEQRRKLNINLPKFMQVAAFKISEKEFEKTPKKSIKRYMYT